MLLGCQMLRLTGQLVQLCCLSVTQSRTLRYLLPDEAFVKDIWEGQAICKSLQKDIKIGQVRKNGEQVEREGLGGGGGRLANQIPNPPSSLTKGSTIEVAQVNTTTVKRLPARPNYPVILL